VFRATINGSEVCHFPGGAKIFPVAVIYDKTDNDD
jgi:hypothetical protein